MLKSRKSKYNKTSMNSNKSVKINITGSDIDLNSTIKPINNNSIVSSNNKNSMSNKSKLDNITKYKITDNEGASKSFENYDKLVTDNNEISLLSKKFDDVTTMSSEDLDKFIVEVGNSIIKCLEHVIDNPTIDFQLTDNSNVLLNIEE